MSLSIADRIAAADNVTSAALFPWIVRAAAINCGERLGLSATAAEMGAPPSIVESIKAAVGATGVPGELSGMHPGTTSFIEASGAASVLLRMVADRAVTRAPLHTRLVSTTATATGAVVAEGAAIPVTPLVFTGQTLDALKVAGVIVATRELWEDVSSPGQQFIIGRLREAVARAADTALFTDILQASDLGTQADIQGALGTLLTAVHTEAGARLYWALGPAAANAAALVNHPRIDPLGGLILGRPAVISSGLEPGQIALVDARALVAEVEAIRVDASDQTSLQMADDLELALVLKSALRPLEARIAALEVEVRAGHDRLSRIERDSAHVD